MAIPMRFRGLDDDGLITPEVGVWSLEKYHLVHRYAEMFATSMRKKWDCRVYIDLFAGAGVARIKGNGEIVAASPVLATSIRHPFDRYLFCEMDDEKCCALKARIGRLCRESSVDVLCGDSNDQVHQLIGLIPKASKKNTVLTYCVVDPYRCRNLKFSTIRSLARGFVDFLVLLPTFMDAHRNLAAYIDDTGDSLGAFLGSKDWRGRWRAAERGYTQFGTFVLDEFNRSMVSLGYKPCGRQDAHLVRNPDKSQPLYHLAFFSRNDLGVKFWQDAKSALDPQGRLF